MPIKYEYDPNLNIVHCRPYGEVSTLEVTDHIKEISIADEVRTGFLEIIHLEDVEDFHFSLKEAEYITKLYNALKENIEISSTIFIGENNLHFEIARMFKYLHDIHYPEGYVFIARNEEEADKFIKIVIS